MAQKKALSFKDIFAQLEMSLRAGKHSDVLQELLQIKVADVPAVERPQLANLLRRSGNATKAVQVLSAQFHSPSRRQNEGPPSLAAQAEMAASLNTLGATDQALHILEKVNEMQYPRVALYRSFAKISQWNYEDAATDLLQFLNLTDDFYERTMAQSNLAACFVGLEDLPSSLKILKELDVAVKRNGLEFLRNNIHLLRAQTLIQSKDWKSAQNLLQQTEANTTSSTTKLLIEKWLWIIDVKSSRLTQSWPKLEAKWIELKTRAVSLRQSETWRDLDLQKALLKKDFELLAKVYHGTPYPCYLKKVLEEAKVIFGNKVSFDELFYWFPGGRKNASSVKHYIDISTGATSNKNLFLKTKTIPFHLMQVLSSDYYRFWNIPSLHSKLFGDRIFNPDSSPGLILEHIQRVRGFLKSSKLGVSIIRNKNFFKLDAKPEAGIRVQGAAILVDAEAQTWLSPLLKHFGKLIFTINDAETVWATSRRTAQRRLKTLCRVGALSSKSKGRGTQYFVT